jgi:hypothetical protein
VSVTSTYIFTEYAFQTLYVSVTGGTATFISTVMSTTVINIAMPEIITIYAIVGLHARLIICELIIIHRLLESQG